MKILVFTEGTLLIDREWVGLPREEIVRRSHLGQGFSIVVKEFGGIDHLPDDVDSLIRRIHP